MTDRETLSASDDPYRRAQKALKILGLTSDKLELARTLSEVFRMYRDLDKKNEM